ncbi:MAG: twin-arginine translocase subunit TatB [Chromatiaceae bacterium]|nr:twin-arginine translocase subunit TatB [Gammaproteobacteria bacterium]MCP5426671.1 twin-arginine translocase subunit TatB [Chromatiaceae bacterium]MCB1862090.1 twin-arginine translocase subunit TatB [Gammaproteobacteria bacterium]MCB1879284.1 twin-arginine translocase subunit TatB [Gammaproteobacteria bacterium]MCB1903122.1 twin-arginine translocase subunit TatB [Gammaproteobacteria bacterium]
MFDIGFWELMLIGLVALVVVGPERLPKLAYTAGKWLGKGRSMLNAVKSEIDKEIKAEELKQILEKQKKQLNPLEEVIEETASTMREFKNDVGKSVREGERKLGSDDDSSTRFGDATKITSKQSDDKPERSS